MDSLKILLISPTYYKTPPRMYGGIELVVWDLACGLANLGHKVTVAAGKGSDALWGNYKDKITFLQTSEAKMDFNDEFEAAKIYAPKLKDFDIVSDHSHWACSYVLKSKMSEEERKKIKLCYTRHTHLAGTIRSPPPEVTKPYNWCAISHSHAQTVSREIGIVVRTAYNGINLDNYPFVEQKGGRAIFIGRLEPFKGLHYALHICQLLKLPLDIIGKDIDTDQNYVRQMKTQIHQMQNQGLDIVFHGEIDHQHKIELLTKACVCIFPCAWQEPFGLVPVEAMACGTPVVAFNNGAIPEVVEHGATGYITPNIDEMVGLTMRATELKPERCRAWVEEKFSKEVMAKRYEQLFQEILKEGGGW